MTLSPHTNHAGRQLAPLRVSIALSRTIILTHFTRRRRRLSISSRHGRSSQYHRSDFQADGSGFSSSYDPDQPTKGPLAQASKHGAPRLTPTLLKAHLDKFVVGQDKAKKVVSVAIFNHYQRIREIRRQEAEEQAKRDKLARWELRERERKAHPLENEFPGHVESVDLNAMSSSSSSSSSAFPAAAPEPELGSVPLNAPLQAPTVIEKSNLLLLGPSGVGKTYILQTLAAVLEVPFATVDCSSLTQAGYIGSDIESSIERLLLAADHSATRCETGIIFFDEVDKLAKPAVMTHGRDVSGEGVQQGLLKMIEGTTVTVSTKSDRNSKSEGGRGSDRLDRGGRESTSSSSLSGKSEQFTIDTRNILFVFAGAFIGLDKIVAKRLSSGSSIGFGAQLRNSSSADPRNGGHASGPKNPLASLLPTDLQTYGLIPELLGRIPILTTLTPLSLRDLISILTEPKNSLVKQYTALLQTSNIQLRFTTSALWAIAEWALNGKLAPKPRRAPSKSDSRAAAHNAATSSDWDDSTEIATGGGIGARALRSILETVLFNIMFKGPGSAIRYCLVDEAYVRERAHASGYSSGSGGQTAHSEGSSGVAQEAAGEGLPRCWSRGQEKAFEETWEREEEDWRALKEGRWAGQDDDGEGDLRTFRAVGSSGM